MTDMQVFWTVMVTAAVTLATRTLSFLLFPDGREAPHFITWLSALLPRAVMAMLLIYCLKDVSFTAPSGFIPPLLGVAATAFLHLWKKQMMLSIVVGTAVYMILIRVIA